MCRWRCINFFKQNTKTDRRRVILAARPSSDVKNNNKIQKKKKKIGLRQYLFLHKLVHTERSVKCQLIFQLMEMEGLQHDLLKAMVKARRLGQLTNHTSSLKQLIIYADQS